MRLASLSIKFSRSAEEQCRRRAEATDIETWVALTATSRYSADITALRAISGPVKPSFLLARLRRWNWFHWL
jgi:hypothetical protein